MRKLTLPFGIVAGIAGLSLNIPVLLILAAGLLAWYGKTELRTKLLLAHTENLTGETIRLGDLDVPIADCALEIPKYKLIFPEVRQLLTWRDADNGTITQIRLVTNLGGKTLAYPAAVLKVA